MLVPLFNIPCIYNLTNLISFHYRLIARKSLMLMTMLLSSLTSACFFISIPCISDLLNLISIPPEHLYPPIARESQPSRQCTESRLAPPA